MQIEVNFETWKECFADLPDPRVEGRTLHRLSDILFMTLCGVICGMDDEEAIEEWSEARLDWPRAGGAEPGEVSSVLHALDGGAVSVAGRRDRRHGRQDRARVA
jgi:hypothetical protein